MPPPPSPSPSPSGGRVPSARHRIGVESSQRARWHAVLDGTIKLVRDQHNIAVAHPKGVRPEAEVTRRAYRPVDRHEGGHTSDPVRGGIRHLG